MQLDASWGSTLYVKPGGIPLDMWVQYALQWEGKTIGALLLSVEPAIHRGSRVGRTSCMFLERLGGLCATSKLCNTTAGGSRGTEFILRCNERFAILIFRVVGCLADRRPERCTGFLHLFKRYHAESCSRYPSILLLCSDGRRHPVSLRPSASGSPLFWSGLWVK